MRQKNNLCLLALLMASCLGRQASVRHTAENSTADANSTSTAGENIQLTQAELRPLSKIEIQNSLQDIFQLPKAPALDGFVEQSSKSQIFRNSYDILNDSSSLAALSRDIHSVVTGVALPQLSAALLQCDAVSSENCRTQLLERIAVHAWRRPLQATERDTFAKQSNDLSALAPAVQTVALAQLLGQIIFDPRFLFRLELGSGDGAKGPYALAPWEKLTAISYDLKHRSPSYEQITALADFESDPSRFEKLIDEIVDSADMAVPLASMISQWLMYYGLENMEIQGDATWSKQKAKDQLVAVEEFVAQVLLSDGTMRSLFTTPTSDNDGYGIFSSKAFLTSTSKHGHGSMILRGVRIIRNALCQNMAVPPGTLDTSPPKNLSTDDPNYDIKLTLIHGSRPGCAGCHRVIDPAGLALHTFDGFGGNTATAVDFNAIGMPSTVTVSLSGQTDTISTQSAKDFAESIANSSTFARCFSRNALRYVLGRDLTEGEIGKADALAEKHLKASSTAKESLANYFRDIMKSDAVYQRIR